MRHLVVLPAYNEQDCLAKAVESLETLPEDFELLVVDDGSTDRTAQEAERLARRCRRTLHLARLPVNCGIGAAVQTGYLFAASRGCYDYVIQFDADGQHDASFIPALVRECRDRDLDLCIGSRFLDPSLENFRSTPMRRIGIGFFARLISGLTGSRVTDPTSGFRCAGPRAWRWFARQYPDDYPEPESLAWCGQVGLRVGEIPARMFRRAEGVSSIRRLRCVYYVIKVTFAILVNRPRRTERTP
jgi:glycosyltransferase involved in cell wall biosynthesis